MLDYLRNSLSGILMKNEKGQTLVEYALILVLIAVVVVIILAALGQTANNTYSTINSAVTSAAS